MFSPTDFQIEWKTPVEPVKCTPARCSLASTGSPTVAPLPGTKLTTPGGSPASSSSFNIQYDEYAAGEAGFQSTLLPISAGLDVRLAPIAVKLNGLIAKTKPSSGRYSIRFQTPGEEIGCSSEIRTMNSTFKRQKSIVSQAASISAWWAV